MFQPRSVNYFIFYFLLVLYIGCKENKFGAYDFRIDNPQITDELKKLCVVVPLSYTLISKREKMDWNDMNAPYSQYLFYSPEHLDTLTVGVIYHNLYKKDDVGLFEPIEYCFDTIGKLRKCSMSSNMKEKAILYSRRTFFAEKYVLNCDLFGTILRNKFVLKVDAIADGMKVTYMIYSPNFRQIEEDFYGLPYFIKIE